LRVNSPPPNLMNSSHRRTQKWTSTKSSMKQMLRGIDGGFIKIKINLHWQCFRLPCHCVQAWCPLCNKHHMVEMVLFLLKKNSDQTKQQDCCRWCCKEGGGGTGVAMVVFVK
jgi:hypothetical protein